MRRAGALVEGTGFIAAQPLILYELWPSFFSCLGHTFPIYEWVGRWWETRCINISQRVGTTIIPMGNDFRNHKPKRKQLDKKGNHFSILLLSWDYTSKTNSHVGACMSTAPYACSFPPWVRTYLGMRQESLEFNFLILLSLCLCLDSLLR